VTAEEVVIGGVAERNIEVVERLLPRGFGD
jgi:hypothetical protein